MQALSGMRIAFSTAATDIDKNDVHKKVSLSHV